MQENAEYRMLNYMELVGIEFFNSHILHITYITYFHSSASNQYDSKYWLYVDGVGPKKG